jgi:hypothetical protein
MSKKKEINTKPILQHRSHISKGEQRKESISELGPSGRGVYTDPGRVSFSAVLDKPLTVKSGFIDTDELNDDQLIDALIDLHGCLLKIEGYQDKKEWERLPTLLELADHVFAEIDKNTPKNYSWGVFKDEDSDHYVIRYQKYVPGLEDYNALCLEWLPDLKAQNENLHNIVMGTIYYIANLFGLEIITTQFDDYYIDDPGCRDVDDEEAQFSIESDVAKYKKGGIANQYYKEMRSFFEVYSKEDLIDMIRNFAPVRKNVREREIKNWLIIGISCLINPADIDNYILRSGENSYEDGNQLTIKDSLNFPWSFYDYVAENTEQFRNDIYSNIGMADSGVFFEYGTGHNIKAHETDPIKNLILFMKYGRDIYFKYYDKNITKFYDNRRNS